MNRLRQDLTYAVRTFAKSPGFTATAILVLTIGIGANTAMFTLVNELLLRPLSGRASALVNVHSHDRTRPDSYRLFSYPNYTDIRDRSGVFESLMAHTFTMVALDPADSKQRALAAVVSSNYFETMGIGLAAGRAFTADEERPGARVPVVITSYARWKREGLDPGFLGRTITINADQYTIVGVTPEGFTGTMAMVAADLYLPLGMFDAVVGDRFKNNGRGLADRSNAGLTVSGALKPGLTDAFVATRIDAIGRHIEAAFPAENQNQVLSVSPVARVGGGAAPRTDTALTTLTALLLGLSGVVLVIACLNIANMLLARGSARRKELAVRLALGASRGRVIRQLLTESLALAAAGAALGLVLSQWTTRTLALWLSAALPFNIVSRGAPDTTVLVATMLFAGLGTIAFGLGPALRLSRRDLVVDLKDRSAEGALSRRLLSGRNLMVIGQIALCLASLTAGGIFAKTTVNAANVSPGFSRDRLVVATVDSTLAGLDETRSRVTYGDLLTRVRSMPGVAAASLASSIPFGESQESRRLERVGDGHSPVQARGYRIAGADYFKTLGLPMVRGREFTVAEETSADAPRVAIVDAAFAQQLFGSEDPIGQLVREAGDLEDVAPGARAPEPMEIIGIAPPIREELLDNKPVAHIYVPFGRHHRAAMHVQVQLMPGADAAVAMNLLRRQITAVNNRMPVLALSSMQAFQDRSLELSAVRATAGVFAGLAAFALMLATIGVYGVRSYVVSERTREIGIRMALGATARDVLRLVIGDGLLLAGIGVGIGLPLAVLLSLGLRSVFVDVGGIDYAVLIVATCVLAATALAASAMPARRAAKVEPLTALRTE